MNATSTLPAPLTKSNAPISTGRGSQAEYLNNLIDQIAEIWPGKAEELRHQLRCEYLAHTLTRCVASTRIHEFKALRDELRAKNAADLEKLRQMEQGLPVPAPRASEPRPQVPTGRYAVEREDGVLAFYRVVVKDGRYTVYVYASDSQHRIKGWKSAQAILRKIESDGPKSASIRYGKEIGACGRCGRTLTDPDSIAAGIGPDCASKW